MKNLHARLLALLPVVVAAGCCTEPKDPDDPAATKQAKLVDAWLEDLAHNRDQEAFDALRPTGASDASDAWNLERFTQRVDRLGVLRSAADMTWKKAHYRLNERNPNSKDEFGERVLTCISNQKPPMALEGSFVADGKSHTFEITVSAFDGPPLENIVVDGKRLRPDGPTIVTSPPQERPMGPLLAGASLDRHAVGPSWFLRIRSEVALPKGASAHLNADCAYGSRWYRHTIATNLSKPLSLSASLRSESPSQCSVEATVFEGRTQQSRSWCWTPTGVQDEPCADGPSAARQSDEAVTIDNVRSKVSDNGFYSVGYELRANAALSQSGSEENTFLAVTLSCGDQKPLRQTRPLSGEVHPVGIWHAFGALFGEQAEALEFPCEVVFDFVRNSPYERSESAVFEGCATRTDLTSGPCAN